MLRLPYTSRVRLGVIAGLALTALSLAGCDTGPHFIGTWKVDRSAMKGHPKEKDDVAEMLSPSLKFNLQFTEDGKLISSWNHEGKEGSQSGTWKMVEDLGLNWRIALNMPPDQEQWEVKVVSIDTDTISLESTDPFKTSDIIYCKAR
jgi:hypothetical protein